MNCGDSLDNLINALYPSIDIPGTGTDEYFLQRTILCARNNEVDEINSTVLDRFPGEKRTYLSADTVEIEGNNPDQPNPYPQEFINTITVSGLPLQKLELKEGAPTMLLRNLAPAQGL